jgi:hypothetical protein
VLVKQSEEYFMSEVRKCSIAFLAYSGAVVTLVIGSALSLALIVSAGAGLSHTSEIEKTLLDSRVESARAIKEALEKSIPRPEPLAPITAKLARSLDAAKQDAKVAAKPPLSKQARPPLSKQARDAFASGDHPTNSGGNYVLSDRHTSNF